MSLPGVASHLTGVEPARDPSVRALVNGRVTSTGAYRLFLVGLAVPFLGLPALLVALAATQPSSGPQADRARPAQLIFAGCLLALGFLVAWGVGRSGAWVKPEGIVRRWGWRTLLVRWEHISGFAASADRRPGVWVLQVGESPLRLPTPWHRLSYPAARDAADQLHRACGFAPPPTLPAGMRYSNGPQPRGLEQDGAADPELRRILTGNVLWSRAGILTALALAPLGLLLPGILCALAATPNSGDMSRPAQLAWAVILFVPYIAALALGGGSSSYVSERGITTRSCWRRRRVSWSQVQAFLADGAGVVVLTRSGARVPARVRLATKAGKERSMREAAYLNGTFGLGVPLRRCVNCQEQYVESRQGSCRFHPTAPISLGTRGDGDQRRSWWMYQCCWLVVLSTVGEDGREIDPPRTGGCRVGAHVSPDWAVPPPPELGAVQSSLESWLQPVRLDETFPDEEEEPGEEDRTEGAESPWPEDAGTRRQARDTRRQGRD
jgi:hypothetical protein